ncbi:S-adenosyl-L-methionine-dependent methyltransferase [Gautieria morchelliformis]|nr:S-adenosyl-L-methionine-dependent methyltransferase [Gautieria morchelliformis]
MTGVSELDSLQVTLNAAIDTIRMELRSAGYPELSTLATQPHPLDESSNLPSRKLFEAQTTAVGKHLHPLPSALGRLQVLIQNPYYRAVEQIYAVYEAASLDIAVKVGVIEVLSNAPDPCRGLHIQELQERLDIDKTKLAIILRLLAAKGWFHETSEGVFAVTRPSLQLRQGYNGWKMIQTPGKPRVAASLKDMITHPKWKYSTSPKETAYQLAFQTDLHMFDHVQPEVANLFAHSVRSLGDAYSPGMISDYPWSRLDSRTIVDCGGGQGSLTILLVPELPTSSFVIQDFPGPLCLAEANLQVAVPEAWEQGRITLQQHDFFKPQPQTGPNCVFLFRWILHDWPDQQVVEILSQAARAGGKGSKVLIVEFIIVPGVVDPSPPSDTRNNKRKHTLPVPPYVPADFGQVSVIAHSLSVHVMATYNGHERTLAEYESLITRAGLTITGVYHTRSPLSVIETEVL